MSSSLNYTALKWKAFMYSRESADGRREGFWVWEYSGFFIGDVSHVDDKWEEKKETEVEKSWLVCKASYFGQMPSPCQT